MVNLIFCSNCGKKNVFGYKDGAQRYHCRNCNTIHYQNPKPTATLVCPNNQSILLVKRAVDPGKGLWGLPGGFIELNETPEIAAIRELKEETNLKGEVVSTIGTCSHFNTLFGDILLIGLEINIIDWSTIAAGDDASDARLFVLVKMPKLAFECHEKIFQKYLENQL